MKTVLEHGGSRGRDEIELLRLVGMHAGRGSLERTAKANTAGSEVDGQDGASGILFRRQSQEAASGLYGVEPAGVTLTVK